MEDEPEEYPVFNGPIVQWPKYSAGYRGEVFTISPVPTDDGRWLLSINDWQDGQRVYQSVVEAIDGALEAIKESVDRRQEQQKPPDPDVEATPATGAEESE